MIDNIVYSLALVILGFTLGCMLTCHYLDWMVHRIADFKREQKKG
jgi:hypothetical protein